MKFCTNCGTKLEPHMVFCTDCGTKTGTHPTQQIGTPPMHHTEIHTFARKNMNYIIITVVAIIGIALFFGLRDNTGLVGTWEMSEQRRSGIEDKIVVRFNRNGTGASRFYENLSYIGSMDFTWEVTRDSQLIMTVRDNDNIFSDLHDFTVSRNVLVFDGDMFTRR